jgi:hypothetical protein
MEALTKLVVDYIANEGYEILYSIALEFRITSTWRGMTK